MRITRVALLLISVVITTTGCLPGAAAQNKDLAEMKRRLAVVEQATVSNQSEQSLEKRLETQSGILADLRAEVDALRFELQRLTGKYEDAVHQREQLHDLMTMIRSELELKVTHLEEKLAAIKAPPVPKETAPVAPESANAGAVEQYKAALKSIQKEGRFKEGRKGLQLFLRDHPKHELAVNAVYWIGEAYYGEKRFEKAILQFQDVIQKYPKHAKAPAAMLKQGLAFGALGDKKMQKTLLVKVGESYPKSSEAKKAKELLKE